MRRPAIPEGLKGWLGWIVAVLAFAGWQGGILTDGERAALDTAAEAVLVDLDTADEYGAGAVRVALDQACVLADAAEAGPLRDALEAICGVGAE